MDVPKALLGALAVGVGLYWLATRSPVDRAGVGDRLIVQTSFGIPVRVKVLSVDGDLFKGVVDEPSYPKDVPSPVISFERKDIIGSGEDE